MSTHTEAPKSTHRETLNDVIKEPKFILNKPKKAIKKNIQEGHFTDVFPTTPLSTREQELEEMAINGGIERYRKAANKNSGFTQPEHFLYKKCIPVLADAIREWTSKADLGKAIKNSRLALIYKAIDPEVIALLTIRSFIHLSIAKPALMQQYVEHLGSALVFEMNYRALDTKAKGFRVYLEEKLRKATSSRYRASVVNQALKRTGEGIIRLTPTERHALVMHLVDLLCTHTGICEVVHLDHMRCGAVYTRVYLQPTSELVQWMQHNHGRCEILSPIFMPMVDKPDQWTTYNNGGYKFKSLKRPLVRGQVEEFNAELDAADLSQVFKAVNAIQETPWRINRRVYDVLLSVWNSGSTLGKLPTRDFPPLPAKPADIATNKEARRAWRRAAFEVHEEFHRNTSKLLSVMSKLDLATEMLNDERFYFPMHLDWRGRLYPSAGTGSCNPQSDDTGKALLEFADGLPLGESGVKWLAIHVANCFGYDKKSYGTRYQWTMDNSMEIALCAVDPLEYTMWADTDDPYMTLAACYAWDDYLRDGVDTVCHLPINMDGTNNGAQHLSALGRDARARVNLVDSEAPQDVYDDVKNVLARIVEQEAAKGDPVAQLWNGKVTRDIVKRPVMTLCYGATLTGMRKQIQDHLAKAQSSGSPIITKEQIAALNSKPVYICQWLAERLQPAIKEATKAAVVIMDWLKECSKVAAGNQLPLSWTTPVGLPVLQKYTKKHCSRVISVVNGAKIDLACLSDTDKIDRRKQSAGVSPNLIHSLDAAHMMLTTNAMYDAGIRHFAMIHDSYGTHACHVETMQQCIRQQFVNMYSKDVLEDFRQQIKSQLPRDLAEAIPPIPEKGTLDITSVLSSRYLFS